MRRFGSGQTVDDQMAAELHERFVSTRPEDSQLKTAPITRPRQNPWEAARRSIPHSRSERRHSGGAGATAGLARWLAWRVDRGSGGGLGNIAKTLGLSTTDPNQMSEDDAARVMNYARKENPDALRQTVQEKPWLVKALGNPVVLGVSDPGGSQAFAGSKEDWVIELLSQHLTSKTNRKRRLWVYSAI